MATITETFKTSKGTVTLSFAWVQGKVRVKCVLVSDLNHAFISSIQYNQELVPVKGDQLGLPFIGDKGLVWLQCSAAVQEALAKIDWGVIKVLLLENARQSFEQDVRELNAEILELAAQKRLQLHTKGSLDRLVEERNIEEALTLIQSYFLTRL